MIGHWRGPGGSSPNRALPSAVNEDDNHEATMQWTISLPSQRRGKLRIGQHGNRGDGPDGRHAMSTLAVNAVCGVFQRVTVTTAAEAAEQILSRQNSVSKGAGDFTEPPAPSLSPSCQRASTRRLCVRVPCVCLQLLLLPGLVPRSTWSQTAAKRRSDQQVFGVLALPPDGRMQLRREKKTKLPRIWVMAAGARKGVNHGPAGARFSSHFFRLTIL